MNKKNKYVLICLPFFVGSLLFGMGVFNLFSSVLFFGGGYVAVKNIFDYRKYRKIVDNDEKIMSEIKNNYQKDYSYRDAEHIVGFKRTRRHPRVRRRVKY